MIVTHSIQVPDTNAPWKGVCRDDLHERLGVTVRCTGSSCCVALTERSTPSDWTGASLLDGIAWWLTPPRVKARQAVTLSAEYMGIFDRLPPDGSTLAWTRRELWPEEWTAARGSASARQRVGSVILKAATHPRREEIRLTQGRMLAYIEAMHPRMLSWSSWKGPCSRRAFAAVVEDWWAGVKAHLENLDAWRRHLDHHRLMVQDPHRPPWFNAAPPTPPVFAWPS